METFAQAGDVDANGDLVGQRTFLLELATTRPASAADEPATVDPPSPAPAEELPADVQGRRYE